MSNQNAIIAGAVATIAIVGTGATFLWRRSRKAPVEADVVKPAAEYNFVKENETLKAHSAYLKDQLASAQAAREEAESKLATLLAKTDGDYVGTCFNLAWAGIEEIEFDAESIKEDRNYTGLIDVDLGLAPGERAGYTTVNGNRTIIVGTPLGNALFIETLREKGSYVRVSVSRQVSAFFPQLSLTGDEITYFAGSDQNNIGVMLDAVIDSVEIEIVE